MHCIPFAFSQCFMHYRCGISLLEPCVLVGFYWAEPMMFFFVAHHMIMHFSCIRTILLSFWYIYWLGLIYFSLSLSPSLSLSLSRIVCTRHPSANPLRPGTLFVPRLLPTLLHFTSGFVMRRPVKTSWRTSLNMAFIRNITLSFRTSPILIYQRSLTVRVRNLFVRSWWVVLLWSYRSFTPICTVLTIPYLVSSLLFEVSV